MTTEELAARTTLETPADREQLSADASAGLDELMVRLEPLLASGASLQPLLAGGRLNRVVEVLSILADLVDITDTHMIDQSMIAFEEAMDGYWSVSNAARVAGNQVRRMQEPPSSLRLIRMAGKPEVRRGLAFMLATAGVLGRGRLAYDSSDSAEV